MKSKKVPRIRLEKRTPLQDVIPLDTPFHLFVDPSSACNFRCRFCFNHEKSRSHHHIMKFELFVKIVSDLKKFPQKLKVLRLYAFGEPLLNRRLPDMIRYAKENGVAETIDFTTNGSWLSPEKNILLIGSGLDAMIVSVGGISAERFEEVCGVKIDFNAYVNNVRHFYDNRGKCRLHIKTTNGNVRKEEEDEFYRIFGDICDEISIDNVTPIWPDLDNSTTIADPTRNIYNREIKKVEVCPYLFYHMTVNADGTVSTCFVDWEQKNIIGNVNNESLSDIWNGAKLNAFRRDHLMMNRARHGICAHCGQLIYGMADNIDEYAAEILEKLDKNHPDIFQDSK